MGGMILKEKAKTFAKTLGRNTFTVMIAWINSKRWINSNNIVFRYICGESAGVNKATGNYWKRKLPTFIKNYETNNVFNADKTVARDDIVAEESTDAEVIEYINKDVIDADGEQHAEEQFIDEPIVSIKETKSSVNTLRVFAERWTMLMMRYLLL